MPSTNPTIKKLSDGLLLGIIKKKGKGGTTKGETRKTARKAYEPPSAASKAKKKGGKKETRKKIGKAKGKPGRPKGGSKVEVVS